MKSYSCGECFLKRVSQLKAGEMYNFRTTSVSMTSDQWIINKVPRYTMSLDKQISASSTCISHSISFCTSCSSENCHGCLLKYCIEFSKKAKRTQEDFWHHWTIFNPSTGTLYCTRKLRQHFSSATPNPCVCLFLPWCSQNIWETTSVIWLFSWLNATNNCVLGLTWITSTVVLSWTQWFGGTLPLLLTKMTLR